MNLIKSLSQKEKHRIDDVKKISTKRLATTYHFSVHVIVLKNDFFIHICQKD